MASKPVEASENTWPWRVGRKVGRTIYMQVGQEASDADVLIGVMDSPEIAQEVVRAHNDRGRHLYGRPHRFSGTSWPGQDRCSHDIWPNGSIANPCERPERHPIHGDAWKAFL